MLAQELRQELCTTPNIIGISQEAIRMREFAARAGATDHTVLLQGETGAGKDQLAELIHFYGRPTKPFVPVDCGALTETLSENELFGHIPGAFTDARMEKKGLVQIAENGTLFFNEIANMSSTLQAKFLRVLEKKTFRQVGGTQELQMNTRVIAATNANLEDAVRRGTMRLDLFHRLSTIMFEVVPLRKRREDIPLLAGHFLRHESGIKSFSKEALGAMTEYHWPGNVRELKNVVVRGVFNSLDEREIQTKHLYFSTVDTTIRDRVVWGEDLPMFRKAMESYQESYLREVLTRTRGHQSKAAEISGFTRLTMIEKIKKFGLGEFVESLKMSKRS